VGWLPTQDECPGEHGNLQHSPSRTPYPKGQGLKGRYGGRRRTVNTDAHGDGAGLPSSYPGAHKSALPPEVHRMYSSIRVHLVYTKTLASHQDSSLPERSVLSCE
jgi:hypothetical protein